MEKYFLIILAVVLFSVQGVFAAHFIVGQVGDAVDGTSANGHEVVLWNPIYGMNDNVTDTIGPGGNSGQNNTYLMDCELLTNGCNVGDVLNVKVVNTGDNYFSGNVSVTVTGAGFDIAPFIRLNSPPNITSIVVDDSLTSPAHQIDLVTASTRQVNCTAMVNEPDGNPLQNISAVFYSSNSTYGSSDDNNNHYTNSSCFLNSSYGGNPNETQIICEFQVWYYADAANWNCLMNVSDNFTATVNASNYTVVNPLLSVGVGSPLDFGTVNSQNMSAEIPFNVTNYGNVGINLSLYGYGLSPGDGVGLICDHGNISVGNERFNLTTSNSGLLSLSQFNSDYQNLTSNYSIYPFYLSQRTNDVTNNAINLTYWRAYLPNAVAYNCTGNIVFGASTAPGG